MSKKLRWFTAVAAIAAFTVAFAACGGDDDNDGGGGSTPAASTPAPGATPGGGASGDGSLAVTAKDFSFALDKDSLPKGGEVAVELTNQGSAPHTITFYNDEDYTDPVPSGDSGRVNGGGSTSFSFTAPAEGDELYYRCEVHPSQMKGEIALQ